MEEGAAKKKEEKFCCIFCAYFWWTSNYSEPKKFRPKFDKISSICPRCGTLTEKAIDSIINNEGEINGN